MVTQQARGGGLHFFFSEEQFLNLIQLVVVGVQILCWDRGVRKREAAGRPRKSDQQVSLSRRGKKIQGERLFSTTN